MTTLLCDLPDIPGYAVQAPLGSGGMATVYRARQLGLDRPVAIKVLRAVGRDTEELNQRFEQEAKLIAALDHPNIVAIYEVTRTAGGDACYVMPLLGDGDLQSWPMPMDQAEVKRIIGAVLDALGHAHAKGVIHRDVKAENVLFDARGTPQLADFGVALKMEKVDRLTAFGRTVGSSHTMSPEQARGETVDGRSDLYSVGCMIFQLLVGHHAFEGDDFLVLALKHQQNPVPRLPADCAHWQPLIDRALAKKPEDRFPTAAAMAAALVAVERPPPVVPKKPVNLRPWLIGVGLLLAVAIGTWLFGGSVSAPDTDSTAPTSMRLPPPTPTPEALPDPFAPVSAALNDGRVFEGTPDSADALLTPAFASEPVDMRALDLRDELLASSTPRLKEADETTLAVLLPRWAAFVEATQAAQTPAAREVVDELEKRWSPALIRARDSRDRTPAAATLPLAQALPEPSASFAALLETVGKLPASGVPFRDAQGPELLLIPAGRIKGFKSALAVTRGEVTRADYARFVQATGRKPGSCRDGGKARSWQDPGFAQGQNEPVVCVSHADAVAYASWISKQTGRPYRLPDLNEWRLLDGSARAGQCGNLAGENGKCGDRWRGTAPVGQFAAADAMPRDLAGNVREWTSSCEYKNVNKVGRAIGNLFRGIGGQDKKTNTRECVGRYVAGSGWRDRSLNRGAVAAEADSAAVDLGFRLVREVR